MFGSSAAFGLLGGLLVAWGTVRASERRYATGCAAAAVGVLLLACAVAGVFAGIPAAELWSAGLL